MVSESTKYRIKNWDKVRERERKWNMTYYYRVRNKIYELLGDECKRCGTQDRRVFQVDHVDGGGNSRKIINRAGQGRTKRILNEIEAGSNRYQLLCANCNLVKKHENKEIKGHVRGEFYKQDISEVARKQRKTVEFP